MARLGRFLLVYGSQTGQAEVIAEQIRDSALSKGLFPDFHCLDKSEKEFHLEKEEVFVVIVSTTGDGDPPDNVARFWRRLRRKALSSDHLAGCNYALLGLGDTNYTNFCNMGKRLNKRLLELGAKQFYPPGYADDGVGLELIVEPWIDGLWEALASILAPSDGQDPLSIPSSVNPDGNDSTTEVDSPQCDNPITPGADNPQSTATNHAADVDNPNPPDVGADAADNGSIDGQKSSETDEKRVSGTTEMQVDKIAADMTERLHVAQLSYSTPAVKIGGELSTLSAPTTSMVEVRGHLATPAGAEVRGEVAAVADERVVALRTCSPELVGVALTLPSLPAAYICLQLVQVTNSIAAQFPFCEISHLPKTKTSMATIIGSRLLTKEGSRKKTREVEFMVPGLDYQPGDAFGVVCPNDLEEVEWILHRLDLEQEADSTMQLAVDKETTKRKATLPKHIPLSCTVRQFFTHCVDIRATPKKAHLNLWSTFCSDEGECRRLQELSSRQGSSEYSSLFTEGRTSFLDLLYTFPSCRPPLCRIIEILPKLQARYYSAASSPLYSPGRLKVAFNVECLPARFWGSQSLGTERLGLATGWLDKSATVMGEARGNRLEVPIFPRLMNTFHLPKDPLCPVIMIGPGTGVAPFIGFLRHREALLPAHQRTKDTSSSPHGDSENSSHLRVLEKPAVIDLSTNFSVDPSNADLSSGLSTDPSVNTDPPISFGKTWLFFGCRNPDTDHIYREELDHFMDIGCLNRLHVAYSQHRKSPQPVPNCDWTSPVDDKTPHLGDEAPPLSHQTPPHKDRTPLLGDKALNAQDSEKTPPFGDKTPPLVEAPPLGSETPPLSSRRDALPPSQYVQDLMRVHWKELSGWLVHDEGSVYVCGDAKNMARDVHTALVDILGEYLASLSGKELSTLSGEGLLQTMKEEGRYLVDAWT